MNNKDIEKLKKLSKKTDNKQLSKVLKDKIAILKTDKDIKK